MTLGPFVVFSMRMFLNVSLSHLHKQMAIEICHIHREFLTTCVVNEVAVSKDELLKSEVDSKRRTSCYYLIPNQLTHSK